MSNYIYNLPLFVSVESDRGDLQADELYALVVEQIGRHLEGACLTANDIDFELALVSLDE